MNLSGVDQDMKRWISMKTQFKNIDRMFLYKNFFFFITNEKKIFIFKTTDMESDELIKIIKTTGILFEKKEKPFNIYKYCKKGKSF